MIDLIDRQAAIDALKNDMASLDHIIKGMSAYDVRLDAYVSQRNQVNYDIDTINNLPPAQPEPCEDAVSRKAVKDGFVEMCSLICPYTEKQRHTMCGSCLLGTAFDVLEATQTVTPKQRTGHWYPVGMVEAVGGESAQWGSAIAYHKCSECDNQALQDDFEQEALSKWCPHCGAKMEGVAE